MKCTHPYETLLNGKCEICGKRLDDIIKEVQCDNRILLEALKWYAEMKLYKGVKVTGDVDLGEKAREALTEVGEIK